MKKSWDKGIDFQQMYKKIESHYNDTEDCRDLVLLIQLRNGSRIREAINALHRFSQEEAKEVKVRVEKRKDGEERLMVLPSNIKISEIKKCNDYFTLKYKDDYTASKALAYYAKTRYGINTHSLRYSFITYNVQQNIPATVIAKMTGHKNLAYILHYTEQKVAMKRLKELI